jgi:hypothetical protein
MASARVVAGNKVCPKSSFVAQTDLESIIASFDPFQGGKVREAALLLRAGNRSIQR